jgi:hypothetical protein
MSVLRKLGRLHIYASQPLVSKPLVPVRGWVSMHPNLLHLQEVVAARCLSILSFSTNSSIFQLDSPQLSIGEEDDLCQACGAALSRDHCSKRRLVMMELGE